MGEYDPEKIRIDADSDNQEWFDDDQFTHAPNDTLYVRNDLVLKEAMKQLAGSGMEIIIREKGDPLTSNNFSEQNIKVLYPED